MTFGVLRRTSWAFDSDVTGLDWHFDVIWDSQRLFRVNVPHLCDGVERLLRSWCGQRKLRLCVAWIWRVRTPLRKQPFSGTASFNPTLETNLGIKSWNRRKFSALILSKSIPIWYNVQYNVITKWLQWYWSRSIQIASENFVQVRGWRRKNRQLAEVSDPISSSNTQKLQLLTTQFSLNTYGH